MSRRKLQGMRQPFQHPDCGLGFSKFQGKVFSKLASLVDYYNANTQMHSECAYGCHVFFSFLCFVDIYLFICVWETYEIPEWIYESQWATWGKWFFPLIMGVSRIEFRSSKDQTQAIRFGIKCLYQLSRHAISSEHYKQMCARTSF